MKPTSIHLRAFPLLGLLCALASPVQAGRPFTTEDAGVLDPSACEWEGVAARVKAPGAGAVRALSTQVGCGLGWNSQLALAVSSAHGDGAKAQSLGINGKTRLIADAKAPLQLTLAWGAATLKVDGGSHRHDTTYLNLVATHGYDNGWTAHANLGAVRSRLAGQDSTTWALAAEKAVGGGLDLGAEIYGDDRSEAWVGLGLRWAASDSWSLNASWARQGGGDGARLLSLGFKFSF